MKSNRVIWNRFPIWISVNNVNHYQNENQNNNVRELLLKTQIGYRICESNSYEPFVDEIQI